MNVVVRATRNRDMGEVDYRALEVPSHFLVNARPSHASESVPNTTGEGPPVANHLA